MVARLQANENNRSVVLDKPIVFVGRHPDCDVVINTSRKVSRKHCCLAEINGQFVVRDLGSTNGIQINGSRVLGVQKLEHGDQLTIGDCHYTFVHGEMVPIVKGTDNTNYGGISPVPRAAAVPAQFEDPPTPTPGPHASPIVDIPLLIDRPPLDEKFDLLPGEIPKYRSDCEVPAPHRKRSNSDSHLELVAD